MRTATLLGGSLLIAGLLAATPASAAPQVLRPVELLDFVATPAPAACELDRSLDVFREARSRKARALYAAVALGAVWRRDDGDPVPIAAVCDSASKAAARVPAGITGTLVDDRPTGDAAGIGYRALEAPLWRGKLQRGRARGLVAGDALTLPAASSATAWVQAGFGTAAVKIPAGGPAQVRVEAAPSPTGAARVLVTRGEQRVVDTTVAPVAAPTISASGRRKGRVLRLTVQGAPRGGYVFASEGNVRNETGALATSSATTVKLSLRGAKRGGRATVVWTDLATRRSAEARCRFSAKRSSRVRCTAVQAAAARASLARRPAAPAAVPAQSSHAVHAARAVAAEQPSIRMRVLTPAAPGTTTTTQPVGDLNGDGHADLIAAINPGASVPASLIVSAADGSIGSQIPVGVYDVRRVGDVNADGQPDLFLEGGWIAFGAGSDLSTLTQTTAALRTGNPGLLDVATPSDNRSNGSRIISAIPDRDGDGKPELVVALMRGGMIISSRSLDRGGSALMPRVVDDRSEDDGVMREPPIADEAGLHVLVETKTQTAPQYETTAHIETHDGSGGVTFRSAPFAVPSTPRGFQRDPVSGSFSISGYGSDYRVLRIGTDGAVAASTSDGGWAAFGPDGPDADALPELYMEGDPGLHVLESTARGSVAAAAMPLVVDPNGSPIKADLADSGDIGGNARSLLAWDIAGKDRWSRLIPAS